MTKRIRYTVRLPSGHQAKFSDYFMAMAFARRQSDNGSLIQVAAKSGLVGQFQSGEPTEEFTPHWAAADAGAQP